jgi:hypothetical protein
MGAWGHNTFENDAALDWVIGLADNQELAFLRDSLEDGIDEDVLAAAEVIAALRGRPGEGLPEDVTEWVSLHPFEVPDDLLAAARDAVTKVRNDSELQELWEESTWLESWHESVDDLLRRLEPYGRYTPDALLNCLSVGFQALLEATGRPVGPPDPVPLRPGPD